MSTISNAPVKNVLQLQKAVLYEIDQLNLPRQPVMEMEVEVHLPNLLFPPGYFKQDLCTLIVNNKLGKGLLYFPPKYPADENGRQQLFDDLRRAAQKGGDCLTLWGKGGGKNQSMYIRCQCAALYRGNKVDTSTGSIVARSDYRNTTYCNDGKNNRPGRKGKNGSH